jgi:hypothetical protein
VRWAADENMLAGRVDTMRVCGQRGDPLWDGGSLMGVGNFRWKGGSGGRGSDGRDFAKGKGHPLGRHEVDKNSMV